MDNEELVATVRWLRDRELIRELPQTYAYGVDTGDWSVVASVFSEDCQVRGTLAEARIAPYLEQLEPGVRAYDATLHFMGNQYVKLHGDRGHVETYAVAYHLEAEGSELPDLIMGVRYQDDVRREGSGWKIFRRNVVKQWHRGPLPRARPGDA